MTTTRKIAALTTLTLALGAPPALAAPGWLPLDGANWGGNATSGVHAAMGPDGDAISAFTDGDQAVHLEVRRAGGPQDDPPYVRLAGSDTIANPIRADVGSAGAVVAVHRRTVNLAGEPDLNGGRTAVFAMVRAADGTRAEGRISQVYGDSMSQPNPEVDVDEAGPAAAVWVQGGQVWAARRTGASGPLGPEEAVGPAGSAGIADVAVAPDGTVVVAWNDGGALKLSRRRPADPAWSAPKTPAGGDTGTSEEQIVMSDAGEATALRRSGTSLRASRWPAATADPTGEATVAANADGGARLASGGGAPHVAYIDGGTGRVAVGAAGAFTSHPVSADPVSFLALAVNKAGRVAVAFGQDDEWRAKIASPAALAGAPASDLSPAGNGAPSIGIDSDGNAFAVLGVDPDPFELDNRGVFFDGAGPRLRNLTVPASGSRGATLAFSVTPFEPITALGATTWSFGDGATASGTSVTHAYARAGTFTVRVTSTDSRGTATTATRTLTVPGQAGTSKPPVRPAADTSAPRLTGVSRRSRRVTLTVSEAATATLAIERRSGRRWRKAKTLRRELKAGANSLRLPKLRPGRYRIRVRATDAAVNRSAAKVLKMTVRSGARTGSRGSARAL